MLCKGSINGVTENTVYYYAVYFFVIFKIQILTVQEQTYHNTYAMVTFPNLFYSRVG